MIKLIVGKEGSGKTKVLIETANESVKKAKGNIVFVDTDNSHMFQIDYRIRFMSLKDYNIHDDTGFYGFLCGIIASNYDIEAIYIDGLFNITGKELTELNEFFENVSKLELKYNVSLIFAVSGKRERLPEYLNKFFISEVG